MSKMICTGPTTIALLLTFAVGLFRLSTGV